MTEKPNSNLEWKIDPKQYDFLCGYKNCSPGTFCGSYVRDGYKETQIDLELNSKQLNYGLSSYNNILNAVTTNLIIVAGDDWSKILYLVTFLIKI